MLNITVTGFRLKLYPRDFAVVRSTTNGATARSVLKDPEGFEVTFFTADGASA